jgi:ribosomal protein S18 acetylase RimI-like enzyme
MPIHIREFQSADYHAAFALWNAAEGVTLRDADSHDAIAAYLAHNAGLSFVAVDGSVVVGAVLCGTDGRRGYLNHLAVARDRRRSGVGRQLAERCVAALAARGIAKCHLMVVSTNDDAQAFWMKLGWHERRDVIFMSRTAPGAVNA